jgi:hypothetical protein
MEGEYDSDFEYIELEFEGGSRYEAAKIEIGDNFVDELENGDLFFVVFCNKLLHQCDVTFNNDWGNTWYLRDMILGSLWYKCNLTSSN